MKFGDKFGGKFGPRIVPGSPQDLARRIYSGYAPWYADGDDPAPPERGFKLRVFAFDEDLWEDVEELEGVVDGNLNSTQVDNFCEQQNGTLIIDDPDGRYADGGPKAWLLKPRRLVRIEGIAWSGAGELPEKIGVFRIDGIPTVSESADEGVPQYTYNFVDWARERIEQKMPDRFSPLSQMVWQAQGLTGESSWVMRQFPGNQPDALLYDQSYITGPGDGLFHSKPLEQFIDWTTGQLTRETEESDWKYTLIGYIWANMFSLLGHKFTVDGTFTDMSKQFVIGKPKDPPDLDEPPPQPLALRAAFGTRDMAFVGAQIDDPVFLLASDFFWGDANEWPTWRQYLQAIFMEDPASNQRFWCFSYATVPARMYYDGDGVLHLVPQNDRLWRGKGFSCDQWRGQAWQLPVESIDRNATAPEFNRVYIWRDEIPWKDAEWNPNPISPFEPLPEAPSEGEGNPSSFGPRADDTGASAATAAPQTERVVYADLHANTKWYQWQEKLDKVFVLGAQTPWALGVIQIINGATTKEDFDKFRVGMTINSVIQAQAILNMYLSRAYQLTITLSNAIPLLMYEVLFIYEPEASVTARFRVVNKARPFTPSEPQSVTLEWVGDM